MKILERRPHSYDKHMDTVSRGRIRRVKETVAHEAGGAKRILEIGCGTGELAEMLVSQGSVVDGFDISPSMIEAANGRIQARHLRQGFKAYPMGVDGMDRFTSGAYDAIVSTLVFSELSDDERTYALNHSKRLLKPGGILLIADEVVPERWFQKICHAMIRLPMLAATYLFARAMTAPIADLAGEIQRAGFAIEKELRIHGGAFAIVKGELITDAESKCV